MSKMIGKQKLIDWIEMQQLGELEELELDRAGAYGTMYEEIESGRFDASEYQQRYEDLVRAIRNGYMFSESADGLIYQIESATDFRLWEDTVNDKT